MATSLEFDAPKTQANIFDQFDAPKDYSVTLTNGGHVLRFNNQAEADAFKRMANKAGVALEGGRPWDNDPIIGKGAFDDLIPKRGPWEDYESAKPRELYQSPSSGRSLEFDAPASGRRLVFDDPAPAAPRFDAIAPPTAFDEFLGRFGNTAIGRHLSGAFGGNMRGSAVGRLMQGMADPGIGAVQLAANAIGQGDSVNRHIAEKEQEYQAARASADSTGFDPLRIAGTMVSPTNIIAASKLPLATTTGARILQGAGYGAASGAIDPVFDQSRDYWDSKTGQVVTGAVSGAVMAPVVSGLARMVKPNTNPKVTALQAEGVNPTIGQTLGGWANRMEEKAQSLPIFGDAITSARRHGLDDFNMAALKRAVAPIGGKITKIGHEGIEEARHQLGKAYDDLLPKMSVDVLDPQFVGKLANLRSMVQSLPRREAQQFDNILQREVEKRLAPNGILSGQNLKDAQAAIRDAAGRFAKSNDAYQSQLGQAFKQLDAELRSWITASNPQFAKELSAIDRGYTAFKRIQRAGASTAAEEGKFNPSQLHSAVKALDRSKDKRAFSEGTAPLQEFSSAAKEVLANKYPDSGTAGRLLLGAGGLASGLASPAIPFALLAGAGGYSRPVQKVLASLATKRPEGANRLADLLRRSTPMFVSGAAATAND